MKLNVIFKVYLSNRNKLGQFEKAIVKVCNKEENEFSQLTTFRMSNTDSNARYVLGHIKEDDLSKYVAL